MTILRQLSELLRDQTKWPDDFVWDYSDSNTCAIGLAHAVELINTEPRDVTHETFPEMTSGEFDEVFFNRGQHLNYDQVTAHEVADRIDELLEA